MRTRIVRIFPNQDSCLRLIRALCAGTHEIWLEDSRYLNMMLLAEQKKELLKPDQPITRSRICIT